MQDAEPGGETQVASTQHLNSDDMYWAIFPGSLAVGREAVRTVNAYTLWLVALTASL